MKSLVIELFVAVLQGLRLAPLEEFGAASDWGSATGLGVLAWLRLALSEHFSALVGPIGGSHIFLGMGGAVCLLCVVWARSRTPLR